jgi:hypothetical protein
MAIATVPLELCANNPSAAHTPARKGLIGRDLPIPASPESNTTWPILNAGFQVAPTAQVLGELYTAGARGAGRPLDWDDGRMKEAAL